MTITLTIVSIVLGLTLALALVSSAAIGRQVSKIDCAVTMLGHLTKFSEQITKAYGELSKEVEAQKREIASMREERVWKN